MVMDETPETRNERLQREREQFLQENIPADDYFAQEEAAARQASAKKKRQIIIGSIMGIFMIVVLSFVACQPPKGTIMYGLCGALLEQLVDYPTSLEYLEVEQFPRSLRIYFNQTDAFGQIKQDMIECVADDKSKTFRFEEVLYNRRPLDKQIVDGFNKTIPVVVSSNPDLTLPDPPVDVLKNLP